MNVIGQRNTEKFDIDVPLIFMKGVCSLIANTNSRIGQMTERRAKSQIT